MTNLRVAQLFSQLYSPYSCYHDSGVRGGFNSVGNTCALQRPRLHTFKTRSCSTSTNVSTNHGMENISMSQECSLHNVTAAGQQRPLKIELQSAKQALGPRKLDYSSQIHDIEGQTEVLWLNGKQVATARDAYGLHIEYLQSQGQQSCKPAASVKYVPYDEILCARYLPIKRYSITLPRQQRKHHFMELQILKRTPGRPWQWSLARMELSSEQQSLIKQWVVQIQSRLQEMPHRPRQLLVFVNPYGGKRQAPKTWAKVAAPVLAAAGVQCQVVETAYQGHAEAVVSGLTVEQLQQLDGIVALGGDGMYSELLTAILQHKHLEEALELRLAHIPAGSTDAVACTLHGTRDALTATLHIALGDCTPLDVARLVTLPPSPQQAAAAVAPVPPAQAAADVATEPGAAQQSAIAPVAAAVGTAGTSFGTSAGEEVELLKAANNNGVQTAKQAVPGQQHEQHAHQQKAPNRHERRRLQQQQRHQEQRQQSVPQLRHFVCVANYGFLGDVMETSERLRWMGPARYDIAGALRFLFLRGYSATVWYKPTEPCTFADREQDSQSSSSQHNSSTARSQQQEGLYEPLIAPAALLPLPHQQLTPTLHAGLPAYDHIHHRLCQQQQQHGHDSSCNAAGPTAGDSSKSLSSHTCSSCSCYGDGVHRDARVASHNCSACFTEAAARGSCSYPSTPATAASPEPNCTVARQHPHAHIHVHWQDDDCASAADSATTSSRHDCAANTGKNAGCKNSKRQSRLHAAGAAAVQASAGSVSSLNSNAATGLTTRASSTTSSSKCHSGCLLCGAATMHRSSSRQLFATESRKATTAAEASAVAASTATASEPAAAPGTGWVKVEGKYASIMCVVTSCRSEKSKAGVCPEAHLADGRLVLVLVEKRSRLQYLRFLLQLATKGVMPDSLPFVKVVHVSDVQVHTHGRQSSWNVDGELLKHPRVHIGVHAGLVDVFARGVEVM